MDVLGWKESGLCPCGDARRSIPVDAEDWSTHWSTHSSERCQPEGTSVALRAKLLYSHLGKWHQLLRNRSFQGLWHLFGSQGKMAPKYLSK